MKIAGVDGCHGGWVVAYYDDAEELKIKMCDVFRDILKSLMDYVIVVDMPIGLPELEEPEKGRRIADTEAKRELSCYGRGGAVFYAPAKKLIDALVTKGIDLSYSEYNHQKVCEISEEITHKRISLQTFGIIRKIIEVNSIPKEERLKVFEFHPEITWVKTCEIMDKIDNMKLPSKKDKDGIHKRIECLCGYLKKEYNTINTLIEQTRKNHCKDIAKDDIVDALSGLIVAKKISERIKENAIPDAIPKIQPKSNRSLPLPQHILLN